VTRAHRRGEGQAKCGISFNVLVYLVYLVYLVFFDLFTLASGDMLVGRKIRRPKSKKRLIN
jgi:hypothetical protein